MPGKPRWSLESFKDGVLTEELRSWRTFSDYINQKLLDYRFVIFRGHASDRWNLESTLDRALKKIPIDRRPVARQEHLPRFQLAVRGRRGSNPPTLYNENDWWALGQHHGLATPLLDWTESPFVALYFAFQSVDNGGADYRSVWGLSMSPGYFHKAGDKAAVTSPWQFDYKQFEIVRPLSDENQRLVNQRGLFVRCPDATKLEQILPLAHEGDHVWHLLHIKIPNKERTVCLRALNRMNINHLSLFPDLTGASIHCNTDLHVKDY